MRTTRIPWFIAAATAPILGSAVWLASRNGSFEAEGTFIVIGLFAMSGWAVVGALLASRRPGNPIGWLMLAFYVGFLLGALADEWATFALVTRATLPLGGLALWLMNWLFIPTIGALPLMLLLYPTGRVAGHRWRWLLRVIVALLALGAIASILRPGTLTNDDVTRLNPTGIPGLGWLTIAVQNVAGVGSVLAVPLCVVALVSRYRRSVGEERLQLRWLAYVALAGAAAFGVAVVASLWDENGFITNGAFYAFVVAIGFGVPTAIGVALLRHRLWDLEVVLKKTLVATSLVVLLTASMLLLLLAISSPLTDVAPDETWAVGVAMLTIGALAWPMLRLSRRIADRLVYGGRATPYEVLTQFSGRVAESYSTEDVLPRMAAVLGEGTGAEAVTIWLRVGGEQRPVATWPAAREDGTHRATGSEPDAFDVRHQGEELGVITVRMPANDPMTPSKEHLIRDLASQAGLVLRNVRLIEELRESRRRIVAAVDEGRRRLERNIHDGAQQQLVALAVKMRLADSLIDRDAAKAHELLSQLQAETAATLEDLRDLARGIYPPLLADKGLAAALEAQARKSTSSVRVDADGIGRYPQEVEATVYFCALEALNNVAKYAEASRVEIDLREAGGLLRFEVRDDGVGFDPTSSAGGTGLQGMVDRVEAVGGRLSIRSEVGRGTTVSGAVPTG